MSGTFMDGGSGSDSGGFDHGHDHGGHDHFDHRHDSSHNHGNDHGHDHGGHDHGHDHGGHEGGQKHGMSLGQLLGLDHNNHHNILSHLLGLDHDCHDSGHADGGHGDHGDHAKEGQAPQQTVIWNSALQSMKLSNLFQGIHISPNVLFFLMFSAFFGWLFVLYWIRHNEPFANQVLGSNAYSPTAAADRRLVAGVRSAMPFKTVPTSGYIYTPNTAVPGHHPETFIPTDLSQGVPNRFGNARGAAPVENWSGGHSSQPVQHWTGGIQQSPYQIDAPTMMQTRQHHYIPHPGLSQPGLSHHTYNVPVMSSDGAKLRTVVNR